MKKPKKPKYTTSKYEGDDEYSWAVFEDGRPKVTGLSRSEALHYKRKFSGEKK